MNISLRLFRGWLYRQYPAISRGWYRKKLAGYERRWGLEDRGFTKEGFFKVFGEKFVSGKMSGRVYELAAGDGLVGNLGVWFEGLGERWRVEAWEHRASPLISLKKNRPEAEIHEGRLTRWSAKERKKIWLASQQGGRAKLRVFAGKSAPARSGLNGSAYGIRPCDQPGFSE